MARLVLKGGSDARAPEPVAPPPPSDVERHPPRPRGGPITEAQKRELRPLLKRAGALDIEEYLSVLQRSDAEWLVAELAYPQFRKVDGEWAVLGDAEFLEVGSVVVNKKDLTQTTVRIKRLGNTRQHLGRTMVYGFMK